MSAPRLSELRHEYNDLFDSCVLTKPVAVQEVVDGVVKGQKRYRTVEATTGGPWFVIAVIHNMECGLDFRAHLHNGEPGKKTSDAFKLVTGHYLLGDPRA